MYLTVQLYGGMSVGCFQVTLTIFSEPKSLPNYCLVTMKLVRIVNFDMKLCRRSNSDVVAVLFVSGILKGYILNLCSGFEFSTQAPVEKTSLMNEAICQG